LNKAFKMNVLIIRKYWGLDKPLRFLLAIIGLAIFLLGTKYLIFLIPLEHTLQIYLFFGVFVFGLPLADVLYTEMSQGHKKMYTYFKNIPVQEMQSYYVYRKFIFFLFTTVFLFFPMSLKVAPNSLLIMTLLGASVMLTTSVQYVFKDATKTKYMKMIVQGLWVLSTYFVMPEMLGTVYISELVAKIPLYYFVILICLFYTITYLNVGRSYAFSETAIERTVYFRFLKSHHLLYIVRTGMASILATILFSSFIGFDQAILTITGFSSTLVSSYLTIYLQLLQNDHNKIALLYKPTELAKIRLDKLEALLKFSLIYLLLAVGIGIYMQQLLRFISAYGITSAVFALIVFGIKINIEKRESNQILTWQDFVKITVLSVVSVLILTSFL